MGNERGRDGCMRSRGEEMKEGGVEQLYWRRCILFDVIMMIWMDQ